MPREVCERLSGRTREVECAARRVRGALRARCRAKGSLPTSRSRAGSARPRRRSRRSSRTGAAVCAEHGFDQPPAAHVWGRGRARSTRDAARRSVAERLPERDRAAGRDGAFARGARDGVRGSRGPAHRTEAMQVVADLQRAGMLIALADDRVTTLDVRAHERYVPRQRTAIDRLRRPDAASDGAVEAGDRSRRARVRRRAVGASSRAAVDVAHERAHGRGARRARGHRQGRGDPRRDEAYRRPTGGRCSRARRRARPRSGSAGRPPRLAMTIDQLAARERHGRIAVDARTRDLRRRGRDGRHRPPRQARSSWSSRPGARYGSSAIPQQLSAIGAGGLLPCDARDEAVPVAELVEIHRTQHQWMRDAQNHDPRRATACARWTAGRARRAAHGQHAGRGDAYAWSTTGTGGDTTTRSATRSWSCTPRTRTWIA